jgi:acyl-CoA dehydrogenase
MSEPDVASSDATNIQTSIRRDGTDWVIDGRKWFITGAAHPDCRVAIVLGVTGEDPDAPRHARHGMVLVPMDAPGLTVVRNIPVMNHQAPEGHCELLLRGVRVPADHLLGEPGQGFAMAQARLGPGRIHHCMRTIGQCEVALALMCDRALERRSFGRYLADYANVQEWIAESRIEIDMARLLVLRAAWKLDMLGNEAARVDVSAIKLVAARLQTRVVDRAIQVLDALLRRRLRERTFDRGDAHREQRDRLIRDREFFSFRERAHPTEGDSRREPGSSDDPDQREHARELLRRHRLTSGRDRSATPARPTACPPPPPGCRP